MVQSWPYLAGALAASRLSGGMQRHRNMRTHSHWSIVNVCLPANLRKGLFLLLLLLSFFAKPQEEQCANAR